MDWTDTCGCGRHDGGCGTQERQKQRAALCSVSFGGVSDTCDLKRRDAGDIKVCFGGEKYERKTEAIL